MDRLTTIILQAEKLELQLEEMQRTLRFLKKEIEDLQDYSSTTLAPKGAAEEGESSLDKKQASTASTEQPRCSSPEHIPPAAAEPMEASVDFANSTGSESLGRSKTADPKTLILEKASPTEAISEAPSSLPTFELEDESETVFVELATAEAARPEQPEDHSSEDLTREQRPSISNHISLLDHFYFRRELFMDSEDCFQRLLEQLRYLKDFEAAKLHLKEQLSLESPEGQEAADRFLEIIEDYYQQYA